MCARMRYVCTNVRLCECMCVCFPPWPLDRLVSLFGLWIGLFSPRLVCLGLMSARIHVCTYVCMYACTYVCTHVRMYGCICVCMYVCKYECMYVYVGRDSWTRLQSVGHRIEATRRSCSQPGWPFNVRATTDRDATGSPLPFCSSAQGVGGRPQAETFCCHARPLKD